MRLFIAVNFDSGVRDLIAEAIDHFPLERPPWRWTRPNTWHITLKFLGERRESDTAAIVRCLEGVAARHRTFPLELKDFDGFPNLRRPRVLTFRVGEGAEQLESMAADVDQTLFDVMGIAKETKQFRAHATVARVKSRLDRTAIAHLESVPPLSGAAQAVESIELMKSTLRREGAQYERLKAFALPPAP
ncbi:MAG: RNA 2',3'-cyclic phosphodiesterase [Candidatus Latescibacterota bacterium]|jgi:2'-5' RNA ligase